MFSNLHIFKAGGDMPTSEALREALQCAPFVPCAPTQPSAFGWVPPRGEHGDMLECIDGHWICALQLEHRVLPAQVVKRRVEELAADIEKQTGRKPRGKVLRELKETAIHELLPRSFTKRSVVLCWVDPAAGLVVIDTSSGTKADAVALALIAAAGRTNLHPLQTELAPCTAMATWLQSGEAPADFSIDRECELKQPDSEKATVRYARHTLDIEEVRGHINQGKLPTQLAMTFNGRVSFTLTDDATLKGIDVLDVVLEAAAADDERNSGFDADVAIATGELSRLIAGLVEALGGVRMLPIEAAAEDSPETSDQAPVPHHGDADTDPLYALSVVIVRENSRASISLVQRHLRIGYNRAARLLERMESEGIVSPMAHNGNRTLLAQGAPA